MQMLQSDRQSYHIQSAFNVQWPSLFLDVSKKVKKYLKFLDNSIP